MPDSPYVPLHNVQVRVEPDPPARKKVVTILHATHCCALGEIDNLSASETPKAAFDAILVYLFGNEKPFVIFSGVVKIGADKKITSMFHPTPREDNYGQAFADWIVENDLGTVMASPEAVNPSGGNTVRIWTWTVNHTKVSEMFRQRRKETLNEA